MERSADRRNFKSIATVGTAGMSNGEIEYVVRDLLSAEGTYYYRVKSNDRDGKSSYSAVQRIEYSYVGNEIVITLNPFKSGISINSLYQMKRLDIIDLSGRILVSKMLNNQQAIRLEAPRLPAGLYHLRVTRTNGDSFIGRW